MKNSVNEFLHTALAASVVMIVGMSSWAGDGAAPQSDRAATQTVPVAIDQSEPVRRLNVLLVVVDDLRPELGTYGVLEISTPNINALARQGTRFARAYTQMATCSPSRTSLLTGLRPDTTGVKNLVTHFRDTVPSVVTLPQYFKQYGYQTQSIGKVYHDDILDDQSWSLPSIATWGEKAPLGPDGKRLAFAAVDGPVSAFADGVAADYAIEALRNLRDSPFFIAVGFKKPHLPFIAPPEFFALYDKYAIPEASNLAGAWGAPRFAFDFGAELRNYSQMPESTEFFDEDLRRELKRGYYAATSFMDAQFGRILAELDLLGLSDDTLVVFLGDHGMHLGEQGEWGKHTNFEAGTRVPLIIRSPGVGERQLSRAVVELVDLYPTICELAGLPVPSAEEHGGYPLEGDSLVPLIDAPDTRSRRGAFSQWSRDGYVGRSIRTSRYRFTEWVKEGAPSELELYDYGSETAETINQVQDARYAEILPDLKTALDAGGQRDLPPSLLPGGVLQ